MFINIFTFSALQRADNEKSAMVKECLIFLKSDRNTRKYLGPICILMLVYSIS